MGKIGPSEWVCIQCSNPLGTVVGGEYSPNVDGKYMRTSGPNLTVTCPNCGNVKVWYTSDPVVRAVYQLVNALAGVAARSMIEEIGKEVHKHR